MVHRRDSLVHVRGILAAAILLGLATIDVHAETGSAAAHDVAVHINVLGVAELDVDPQASVAFDNATDPTHQQDALLSIDAGNAFVHLSTGATSAEAQYDPGVSLSSAGADTQIVNLDLFAESLLGDGLLSISADLIESRSIVMGYCLPAGRATLGVTDDITFFNGFDAGNLTPGGPGGTGGGNVVLTNPGVSILGIPVTGLPNLPPPNTSIDLAALGIVGATLILNEQTIGGDGVDMGSMSSNALHLTLNTADVITADIVIGHSEARLDCTQ